MGSPVPTTHHRGDCIVGGIAPGVSQSQRAWPGIYEARRIGCRRAQHAWSVVHERAALLSCPVCVRLSSLCPESPGQDPAWIWTPEVTSRSRYRRWATGELRLGTVTLGEGRVRWARLALMGRRCLCQGKGRFPSVPRSGVVCHKGPVGTQAQASCSRRPVKRGHS